MKTIKVLVTKHGADYIEAEMYEDDALLDTFGGTPREFFGQLNSITLALTWFNPGVKLLIKTTF